MVQTAGERMMNEHKRRIVTREEELLQEEEELLQGTGYRNCTQGAMGECLLL